MQGSIWILPRIFSDPAIVINAAFNVPYWMAQAYLLQEPFGVVLIVLAFLMAGFMVNPIRCVCVCVCG
jgi:hypothetical protein